MVGLSGHIKNDTARFDATIGFEGDDHLSDVKLSLAAYPEKGDTYIMKAIAIARKPDHGEFMKLDTIKDTALLKMPQAIELSDKQTHILRWYFESAGAKHYSHKMQLTLEGTLTGADGKDRALKQVMVFRRVLHVDIAGN